jgi:hypothetical protein
MDEKLRRICWRTNSMQQSPSWENNIRSAGQEIPYIFRNTKFSLPCLQEPASGPLSWARWIQSTHSYTIYFRSILIFHRRLGLTSGLLFSSFPNVRTHFSSLPCVLYTPPISFSWLKYKLWSPLHYVLFLMLPPSYVQMFSVSWTLQQTYTAVVMMWQSQFPKCYRLETCLCTKFR